MWAHPFWDVADPELVRTTVNRFHDYGIDGVECFYVTHSREQATLLQRICSQLGLLATGSADFHGPEHRLFAHFRAFSTYGLEPDLGPLAARSL